MLEIYNEEVRDLLVSSNPRGGMKIRENPATGFYGKQRIPHLLFFSFFLYKLYNKIT